MKIFNLSKYKLNPYEISLLEKGLNFCPNNQVDHFDLFVDLQHFVRKLTLQRYFSIQEKKENNRMKKKEKKKTRKKKKNYPQLGWGNLSTSRTNQHFTLKKLRDISYAHFWNAYRKTSRKWNSKIANILPYYQTCLEVNKKP